MTSRNAGTPSGPQAANRGALPETVQCHICEAPFSTPTIRDRHGSIPGLMVCTQCVEDAAEARASMKETMQ